MEIKKPQVYVCTDLDRTLLPNGHHSEPVGARENFSELVSREEIGLVYVSGRDRGLILDAIDKYVIPTPDFVVADVGTSVYEVHAENWQLLKRWHDLIGADWQGNQASQLRESLGDVAGLTLQAPRKQGSYKLSYERCPARGLEQAVTALKHRLKQQHYACHCIVSVDETTDTGLLDVVPESASKRAALEFLADYLSVTLDHLVFSGDSGNDLDVLLSPMRATLVGNATDEVRKTAIDLLAKHQGKNLYLANQYYAAGIVEGFYHYFPQYLPDQQDSGQQELSQC